MIPDKEMRLLRRLGRPELGLGASLGLSGGGVLQPALNLDFLSSETLDSRISFSRGSTGTRVNAAGLIETVASGQPRFDYDPVTLAPRGLLIEEARTNIALWSEAFDNILWTAENATVGANQTTAPDGNPTADKIVSAASTARTDVTFGCMTTAGAWTLSFFVKYHSIQYLQLFFGGALSTDYANFDIQRGSVVGGTYTTATITAFADGWYRISITTAAAAASSAIFLVAIAAGDSPRAASFAGDGLKAFYAWGAQMEAGAFATSYIPSTSAQANRAADVASMTGGDFAAWYNQWEGTFAVDLDLTADSIEEGSNRAALSAYDGTSGNRNMIYNAGTGGALTAYSVVGGIEQAFIAIGSGVPPNSPKKFSFAYKRSAFQAAYNGTLGAPDTGESVPTVDRLGIGGQGGNIALNGHIRSFKYYAHRLDDTALVKLTV